MTDPPVPDQESAGAAGRQAHGRRPSTAPPAARTLSP